MRSAAAAHADRAHDWLIGGFAVLSLGTVVLYRPQPQWDGWTPAALLDIALAIWHGAYDTVLARNVLRPSLGKAWQPPFFFGYLGLAATVLALWWAFPVLALVAFLLYSAFHFGTEGEPRLQLPQAVGATAFGALPIAAAARWSPAEVERIFAVLLRGHAAAAATITMVAGHALLPFVALSVLHLLTDAGQLARRGLVLAVQLLLFRMCPPLLAFSVFFCLWHTPEHLLETSRDDAGHLSLQTVAHNLRGGTTPWLLSLTAVALAAWRGQHTLQAYTALIFLALSALTVPHMVLALLVNAARPSPRTV